MDKQFTKYKPSCKISAYYFKDPQIKYARHILTTDELFYLNQNSSSLNNVLFYPIISIFYSSTSNSVISAVTVLHDLNLILNISVDFN